MNTNNALHMAHNAKLDPGTGVSYYLERAPTSTSKTYSTCEMFSFNAFTCHPNGKEGNNQGTNCEGRDEPSCEQLKVWAWGGRPFWMQCCKMDGAGPLGQNAVPEGRFAAAQSIQGILDC